MIADDRTAFVTGGSGFLGGHLVERLVRNGWTVHALARSDAAAEKVKARGAQPVRGDLEGDGGVAAVRAGAAGAAVAFHAAASTAEWAPRAAFERANVEGTRVALEGCRAAGVPRFVHVSTEAVLMAGQPLVDVDETAPVRPDSPAPYPATKAAAEQLVRAATTAAFATVSVRPRLVWGPGDTTILPGLVTAARQGRLAWFGGGTHLTDTTHVANAAEGLVLAAERGSPGEVYFVTDGEPIAFRDFATALLTTAGVAAPTRSLPVGVGTGLVAVAEPLWRVLRLPGAPPLSRMAFWLVSQQCTIRIDKARAELGHAPVVERAAGLAALAAADRPAG